ncbi:MAG: hypothetical protein ABSD86_09440 [Candidatus Sulfotelmatobacter sp.]
MFGVRLRIVVSHDRPEAVSRSHLAQDASAWFGRERPLGIVFDQGHRNEISRENDQVGAKAIHKRNDSMQGVDGKIRVIMKVAEQRDGETIHSLGPAWQPEILAHDVRAVRL